MKWWEEQPRLWRELVPRSGQADLRAEIDQATSAPTHVTFPTTERLIPQVPCDDE